MLLDQRCGQLIGVWILKVKLPQGPPTSNQRLGMIAGQLGQVALQGKRDDVGWLLDQKLVYERGRIVRLSGPKRVVGQPEELFCAELRC